MGCSGSVLSLWMHLYLDNFECYFFWVSVGVSGLIVDDSVMSGESVAVADIMFVDGAYVRSSVIVLIIVSMSKLGDGGGSGSGGFRGLNLLNCTAPSFIINGLFIIRTD